MLVCIFSFFFFYFFIFELKFIFYYLLYNFSFLSPFPPEFAHLHLAEKDQASWHVQLSQKDAKEVVEKGWGEYLPLSSPSLSSIISPFVSFDGLVMVYGPRDGEEAEVFRAILMASYRFCRDQEVK